MEAELAVLEAMSKVDVNFAALRFAIDNKIGFGGRRKDWWSGRVAACLAVMYQGA